MKICKINDCEKPIRALGFCEMHYCRFKKHGDPLITLNKTGCEIDNCNNDHYAKGYCLKHYYRIKKHGKYEPSWYEISIKEKFKQKTKLNPDNGCIEWIAGTSNGYGVFKFDGKTYKAHRYSYEKYYGDIPTGMFVCHTCDNRRCCNPLHLFVGTNADNMADMKNKGRARSPRGEDCHTAILKEDEVVLIKNMIKNGCSPKQICNFFNITYNMVMFIKHNRSWKHIQDEVK